MSLSTIDCSFTQIINIPFCQILQTAAPQQPIFLPKGDRMETSKTNVLWGKLVPLAKGLNTYPLRDDKVMLGRSQNNCKITINEKRLSSQHCLLEKDGEKVFITDLSTNGTYLNTEKIGKNNRIQIHEGDQLWLLPISRVTQEETIGFKLSFVGWEPKKKVQEARQNEKFINSLKEQITCAYCREIMVYPVIVQPCNHRFCGPCLTLLVNKKKGQCIICRKQLLSAARDASFNAIIDDYVRSHPDEKRNDEDQMPNIFGFTPTSIRAIILGVQEEDIKPEITIRPGKQSIEIMADEKEMNLLQKLGMENQDLFKVEFEDEKTSRGRGRGRGSRSQPRTRGKSKKNKSFISSDISASTDQQINLLPRATCLECVEERNGFKCEPSQPHINCHNCHKPFPIRQEDKLYQRCIICRSYFCNLYMPPCQKNGPKLVLLGKRADGCQLDPIFFRGNKVEMDAFKNLLISEKKNIKDMFKDMLGLAESGRFQFMFDKRILRNAPEQERVVRLDKRSPVCDNCWRELWFQMIFMFVKEHAYLMPDTIKNRPVCYWGINCRTMAHNIEHAKKFNHMEYQTRF